MSSEMKILSEGLRKGDLADIVLPLLSIDEFESKISDDAMVFGLFVNDRDAANDLNRFVQKSPYDLLDTDVSPAPDIHGYYLVFIEILVNEDTAKTFNDILSEIGELTNIKIWSMRVRDEQKTLTYTEDRLKEIIGEFTKVNVSEVAEFIAENSQVYAMHVVGDSISFYAPLGEKYSFILGDTDTLNEGIDMAPKSVAYCNRLQKVLGDGWSVFKMGDQTILEYDERTIILK